FGVRVPAGVQVLPPRGRHFPGESQGASRERSGAHLRDWFQPAARDPDRGLVGEGETMFNKQSKPQNRIDSLIGATTRIEGNVVFSGGLRVDGMVRGNVSALNDQPGTLVVSSDARIDGEVQAAHIVVNGTINGPVHATETLELQAGSRV